MFIFDLCNFLVYIFLLVHTPLPVSAANPDPVQPPGNYDEWTGWGGNVYNNRWNTKNTQINSTSVGQLTQNCQFDYPHGVSAAPVVLNYTVFYPTINGSFYALNYVTCEFLWHVNVTNIIYNFQTLSALTEANCLAMSRTSPQIDGDVLYLATQANALLIALDVNTGDFLGTVQVNNHPLAICTMSPTVYNGMIFIGTSSQEETATLDPNYDCCSFIGNFAAYTFDRGAKKFTQVWEINTMPVGQGWSGAGVWGSQPSIDPGRNQVFIGTGNTYVYPIGYEHCVTASASCLPDDVWQESIIAFDIPTGKVNWRQTISPLDGWVMACGYAGAPTSNSSLCPGAPGPDSDFAMAPAFVPAALGDGTTGNDSVVVGQKNGDLYSINAETGDIQWMIPVGGDNSGSWLSWGVAVDDTNVYFTGINYGFKNWTLQPSGQLINNSAWGAVTLKTGQPTWETPCPNQELAYTPPGLVNDVVFVGQSGSSTANVSGAVVALSKKDGSILHTFPINTVQDGGIVARGGFVMFGTGYAYRNPFNYGSFYVFALPGAVAEAEAAMATKPTTVIADPPTSPTPTGKKKSMASRIYNDVMSFMIFQLILLTSFMVWLS